MASLPPPAALKSARARRQTALAAVFPGVVVIAGASLQCSVAMDPVEPDFTEAGGHRLQQWLHLHIAKSTLAAAPAVMTQVLYQNLTFTVRRISGHEDYEQAWVIAARRTVRPSEA